MHHPMLEMPCVPALRRIAGETIPRGSSPRTRALAADAAARHFLPYGEQAQLYAAFVPPQGLGRILTTAHAFAHVHPRLTPLIRDGELIVGARHRTTSEEVVRGWLPDGTDSYVDSFARNTPSHRPDIHEMALRGLLSPQGSMNHKVVDYARFLRVGSAALAERARRIAAERTGEQQEFAIAFAMGHEAMIAHAETYARECLRAAETADPGRAAELRELARICARVPREPAETFHEAIQMLWFAYMVAGDGVGRPDVYLNDYYDADLAAGRITPERARELIECLMIKLHGDYAEGVYNVSSIHTMTLGGVLPDGSDACNALTRLFLQAIRSVRLLRPTIYVRCHDGTPENVLELAVEMLGEGLAEPNFYGDTPVIDGLQRLGVPVEQARDYALSGCTEIVLPGLANWGAPNGWINLAMVADEAIGELAAAPTPTRELLWQILERRADELAEVCRICNEWVDDQREDGAYNATLLMPVCLEKCRDIVHGGAASYMGHWEAIGLPNAADMLHATEVLVLNERQSLPELLKSLQTGDPTLRKRLRRLPRFGNGDEAVDALAARLVTIMADALERRGTPLRSHLVMGHLAGGENMHISYGLRMGPTLDGRRAGEALADSLAGSQGATRSGPTAVIRSLCRLDHSRMVAGNASTLRLLPADFLDQERRRNVVGLIRTFVALGGSQLQINIVDAETLRAAQADPEAHEGLMVRVAGYSADFTHCGKMLQDEIIARLER
ncbi:MAG TPA: hypothetical protein DGT21_10360 [Armatimonadetes bacterium]|nr:hypothetical protein [Armatimonadota bacterium]